MLARPEVQSHQYSFAGSITLVFASGVGLCLGQPQLRGERRFERPRRGTEDQGRAARARNGGTGGRLRRPGQGEARGVRPRTTLSSLAERLNDGRRRMGGGRQSGERDPQAVRSGRATFRVALLPAEIPASREPGLRLNPQLRRIPAEMRAELTSAEIAMSGSYFDDRRCSRSAAPCARSGIVANRRKPRAPRSLVLRSSVGLLRRDHAGEAGAYAKPTEIADHPLEQSRNPAPRQLAVRQRAGRFSYYPQST